MTTEIFEPSYTVTQFCAAERMSKPKYYELKNAGLGPKEMRHGGMIRISHQARLEWQQKLQQPTEAQRATDARLCARSRTNLAKAVASPKHVSKRRV